jgi:hypothetical protein
MENTQVPFEGKMANLLLRLVPAGVKHLHTKTVTNPSFLTSSNVISASENFNVLATLVGPR